MYKEGEQSFIRWIKKRIYNNLNYLCLLSGSTGIGKSFVSITMAHDIDNEFEARQIAFSFKQVMEIINSDWFKKKKWKIIIFDEVQIDISNRAWQSLTNKLFNYLLSTFRHQNIILLFTTPFIDFLDLSSRKLLHSVIECKGWSKKTNMSLVRPKLLQYNSRQKKFYEHSLFVIRDSKMNKLINWELCKPPKHLIIPYEKAKFEFTNKLNQRILRELNALEEKDNPKEEKQELNPDSMQPMIWEIAQKGYNKIENIKDELEKIKGKKVSLGQVGDNVVSMRKKGYDIRVYKRK